MATQPNKPKPDDENVGKKNQQNQPSREQPRTGDKSGSQSTGDDASKWSGKRPTERTDAPGRSSSERSDSPARRDDESSGRRSSM